MRPGWGLSKVVTSLSMQSLIRNPGRKWYSSTGLTRNAKFTQHTEEDVSFFKSVLGSSNVLTSASALAAYNTDWMGRFVGAAKLALRPESTAQVQSILRHCNERKLAVVPQGGNTGLVGGSVPVFDEIVISTSRMNQIQAFDPVGGIVTCQAGCILESLNEYVAQRGFVMPLDLGAKGSCQIGGNVATNAGGLRVVRHGSLHGSVLGIEAVLADGTILDLNRPLRKDNTGIPLHHLFIGSEGVLGIITSVSILLPPQPVSVNVALLACQDFDHVQELFTSARSSLGEILSAVEFLDRESMELALKKLSGVQDPLPDSPAPFYVLLETSGSNAEHDCEKIHSFLETVMEDGKVLGGTLAQGGAQAEMIWRIREGVTEALSSTGSVYKYDLSMAVPQMYELVEEMRSRLNEEEDVLVVGYGHLGDGNLHLNICAPGKPPCERLKGLIEPFVYEWTGSRGGSISAEHGVGQWKAEHLPLSKSPEAVKCMRAIKELFDPNGIMNPYKVFPSRPSAD